MKYYEELTGFVEIDELEDDCDEFGGTGTPCAVIATVGLTVKTVTAIICETGACTGHCK